AITVQARAKVTDRRDLNRPAVNADVEEVLAGLERLELRPLDRADVRRRQLPSGARSQVLDDHAAEHLVVGPRELGVHAPLGVEGDDRARVDKDVRVSGGGARRGDHRQQEQPEGDGPCQDGSRLWGPAGIAGPGAADHAGTGHDTTGEHGPSYGKALRWRQALAHREA